MCVYNAGEWWACALQSILPPPSVWRLCCSCRCRCRYFNRTANHSLGNILLQENFQYAQCYMKWIAVLCVIMYENNVECFMFYMACAVLFDFLDCCTRSTRQWHGRLVGLWAYARKCECESERECMCVHNVPEYKTTHYSGGRMIVSHFMRCCCCCCCCSSAQWVTLTFSWEIISLSFLMCGFHAHTHTHTRSSLTLFNTLTFALTLTFLKPFDLSPYNFILRPFQS